jgi:hypothetical protein
MPKENLLNTSSYDEVKQLIIENWPITSVVFCKKYKTSHNYLTRISSGKTWNQIVVDCSLTPNIQTSSIYNEEDILKDIKRIHDIYGSVGSTTYRKLGMFSQKTIEDKYGSYSNALIQAGLRSRMISRDMSNADMIEEGKIIVEKYDRIDSKIITERCNFSVPTIISRFGSCSNFYNEIGYVNNHRNSNEGLDVLSIISEILNSECIKEKTFNDLVGIGGKKLYYDGFFESHNLLVEYNGIQHYTFISKYHSDKISLAHQVANDNLKMAYAINSGFNFIAIPYGCNDFDSIRYIIDSMINVT